MSGLRLYLDGGVDGEAAGAQGGEALHERVERNFR